jgi:hypothetical protein
MRSRLALLWNDSYGRYVWSFRLACLYNQTSGIHNYQMHLSGLWPCNLIHLLRQPIDWMSMEYGLHTSNAWMIGHNNSIAESRGRFVRWSIVRYGWFYSERQGVHSCSSEERCEEIHVLRRESLEEIRSPTYAFGLFRLESSTLFLPWWWFKIMALKKFSIENRTWVYRLNGRTVIAYCWNNWCRMCIVFTFFTGKNR